MRRVAQPFRFHVPKRARDELQALEEPERRGVAEALAAGGMRDPLEPRLTRAIGQRTDLEVRP